MAGPTIHQAANQKLPASAVALADGTTLEANNTSDDAADVSLDARLDTVESNELTRVRKPGIIPSARLVFTGNAVDTKTVTIAGEVWTSVAGAPAANEFQVGGGAEASIDNFVAAFNAGTTKNLKADKVGTDTFRIRLADAPNGNVIPGTTSMVLSETQDNATWNVANINETGETDGIGLIAHKRIAMTTLNVAGVLAVECPFTPKTVVAKLTTAAGIEKAWSGTVTISGTTVLIDADAGASPAANTDILDLVILGDQS